MILKCLETRSRSAPTTMGAALLSLLGADGAPAFAGESLEEFGDVMQYVLPLSAAGATLIYRDEEGFWQYAKQFGTSAGVTAALKFTAAKLRPSRDDRTSWPSGHTMAAFSGASFLQSRYGWGWGVPAYVLAGAVGYSRVDADKHFLDDVIAGASISLFSNWLWVAPFADDTTISPTLSKDGFGLQVQVKPGSGIRAEGEPVRRFPYWNYSLGFGPAYLDTNRVSDPESDGSGFDLKNFRGRDDPTTTSVAEVDFGLSPRHLFRFSLAPFEARDDGQFEEPVLFDGKVYPANERIDSAYRLYEARATYLYELLPESQWSVAVGAGLAYQWSSVELAGPDPALYGEINDDRLMPLLAGAVAYRLNPDWEIGAEAAGMSLSDDEQLDVTVRATWYVNYHWALSVGYEYFTRTADTDQLFNDLRYDIPHLSLSYTF